MNKNMKQWVKSIIDSSDRKAMPIMTYPGLQLTGDNIMNMVTRGEVQYECIMALTSRYPTIASATLIMDLSVEAEAFGSKINYHQNDIPTVSGRLINNFDELNKLRIPEIGTGRTEEYLKASRLCAENITDRPVFGGIIGPFSLAGRLYGITEMMTAILMEPDGAHELLSKCVTFLKQYIDGFKEAGTHGIVIAEPAAGLLSADQCHEFSSEYVKMLVGSFQNEHFIFILHNCGNTTNLVNSMVSTGCIGFHFGNAVDMLDILPKAPDDRLVFGNIDPAGILKNGSKEIIISTTIDLLERTSSYKNFILSSGCDIPPGTPLSNIDAYFEALQIYNNKHNLSSV
jgi:uroporphyrinogen decarboxylase